MRHKARGSIIAVLLTVLIVAAGTLIPRLTLSSRRAALLSRSGEVEAKSLTPYENNSKSLIERIGSLSVLADAVISGSQSKLVLTDARAALDTELSAEDAVSAAYSFLSQLAESSAAYGLVLFDGSLTSSFAAYDPQPSVSPEYNSQSTVAPFDAASVSLLTAAEDSSLSMWLIYSENRVILLDALSGMPVYAAIVDETLGDLQLKLADDDPGAFWQMAADAYNSCYGNQARFSMEPSEKLFSDYDGLTTWRGESSEGLSLEVSANAYHITGMTMLLGAANEYVTTKSQLGEK